MLICPIISSQMQNGGTSDCREDKCAMWDKELKQCSIVTIAHASNKFYESVDGNGNLMIGVNYH